MRALLRHAAGIWIGLTVGNFLFALAMLLIAGDAHSLADAAERSFFQLIAIAVLVWAISP